METYLSFALDTQELPMGAKRFDALMRRLSARAARRGLLAGLAGGLLAVGPLAFGGHEAGARNKHKKHKKKKPHHSKRPPFNAFGCVDVGQACRGNDNFCCSGICEGETPKKGKRDTSLCVAHHTGDCTPEITYCTAGTLNSKCVSGGADAYCLTTTGHADFCGNVKDFVTENRCRSCEKDTDCEAITGPGSACVVINGGPYCTGMSSCKAQGSSNGTTCMPAGI
jgi:hypothetical protein